jgi:hypothetical protein
MLSPRLFELQPITFQGLGKITPVAVDVCEAVVSHAEVLAGFDELKAVELHARLK